MFDELGVLVHSLERHHIRTGMHLATMARAENIHELRMALKIYFEDQEADFLRAAQEAVYLCSLLNAAHKAIEFNGELAKVIPFKRPPVEPTKPETPPGS